MDTVWGGEVPEEIHRFLTYTDTMVTQPPDLRMFREAIQIEDAFLKAYLEHGVIDREKYIQLSTRLRSMEIDLDEFKGYEDIHSYLEEKLGKEYPYICRSRNETIVSMERLYLRRRYRELLEKINRLVSIFTKLSKRYGDVAVPTYTHYQVAGLTTYNSYISSYLTQLGDLLKRIWNLASIVCTSPHGASAISGCPFLRNIHIKVSNLLGYRNIHPSPLEAIHSRIWHQILNIDIVSSALNLYSRVLHDTYLLHKDGCSNLPYTTGSSMLTHKENPDILELMRAKAFGAANHLSWLKTMEVDNTGYTRAIQETKYWMIYWTDTLHHATDAITKFTESLEIVGWGRDDPALATWITQEISIKTGKPYREIYKYIKKMSSDNIDRRNLRELVRRKYGVENLKSLEEGFMYISKTWIDVESQLDSIKNMLSEISEQL